MRIARLRHVDTGDGNRSRRQRDVVVVAAVVLGLLLCNRAQASPCTRPEGALLIGQPAQAQDSGPCTLSAGNQMMVEGKAKEALSIFVCAARRSPTPWILAAIGQTELELGKKEASIEHLRCAEAFLRRAIEGKERDADVRDNLLLLSSQLDESLVREGQIQVRAFDRRHRPVKGARLHLAEAEKPIAILPMAPLRLPVGPLRFRLTAPDHDTLRFGEILYPTRPGGQAQVHDVEMTARFPLHRQWWLWASVGAVAAALTVGLAVGLTERPDELTPLPLEKALWRLP